MPQLRGRIFRAPWLHVVLFASLGSPSPQRSLRRSRSSSRAPPMGAVTSSSTRRRSSLRRRCRSRRLSAAAERFGNGDLEAHAAVTRTDEIGDLAAAFNEMARFRDDHAVIVDHGELTERILRAELGGVERVDGRTVRPRARARRPCAAGTPTASAGRRRGIPGTTRRSRPRRTGGAPSPSTS